MSNGALFPNGLVILGSGGHAKVVADAALLTGWQISGHLGPGPGKAAGIGPYLGTDEEIPDLARQGQKFVLGFGFVNGAGAARRAAMLARLLDMQVQLPVIRHPSAVIAASAQISAGCFIAAGAVVSVGTIINTGAIINTASVVDHDCQIGMNTHVATGAKLAGDINIGDNALLGIGCALRQGLQVGKNAIVGAGAVVIDDVDAGKTVVGCPAR